MGGQQAGGEPGERKTGAVVAVSLRSHAAPPGSHASAFGAGQETRAASPGLQQVALARQACLGSAQAPPFQRSRPGAALGNDLSRGEARWVSAEARGRGSRASCPPNGLRARGQEPAGGSWHSRRFSLPRASGRRVLLAALRYWEGRSGLREEAVQVWRPLRSSPLTSGEAPSPERGLHLRGHVCPLPSLRGRISKGAQGLGVLSGQNRVSATWEASLTSSSRDEAGQDTGVWAPNRQGGKEDSSTHPRTRPQLEG